MDTSELDLPTMVSLAGQGTVQLLLDSVAAAGHPGVRASHGYVFQRLVEGEPTISALATSLGMTQQGASKQVRDLEQRGYVERISVDGDLRARRVRLTEAGRAVLAAGRQARADLEAELVSRVGAETVATAKLALTALLELVDLDAQVRTRTVPVPADD